MLSVQDVCGGALSVFEVQLGTGLIHTHEESLRTGRPTSKGTAGRCEQCSEHGRYCKLCANGRAFFPYDVRLYYACPSCKTAFHQECFKRAGQCPICACR